jgi:hypothetical protein
VVSGYDVMKDAFDLVVLIKAIKGLSYQFEGGNYHPMAIYLAHKRLYGLYKMQEITNTQFLKKFMTCVSVTVHYGGGMGRDK